MVLLFYCGIYGIELCFDKWFPFNVMPASTPKQIRELMKVDGLTNDEVKSHLQVDYLYMITHIL